MTTNFRYLKTRVVRYPALAFTVATALIATGLLCGLKSADWASWAQAFGSLVGIGIAISIPLWQKRHEKHAAEIAKRERDADLAYKISIVAEEVLLYVITAKSLALNSFVNYQDHLAELVDRLTELRSQVNRATLRDSVCLLTAEMRHLQLFAAQIRQGGVAFSEQFETYQSIEQTITRIKINSHINFLAFRGQSESFDQ